MRCVADGTVADPGVDAGAVSTDAGAALADAGAVGTNADADAAGNISPVRGQ